MRNYFKSKILKKKHTKISLDIDEVLNLLPVNVYWVSSKGTFLGCNKRMLSDIGLNSIDQYRGKTYEDLYQGEYIQEIKKTDQFVMLSNETITLEEEGNPKNERISVYLTTKSPLHDKNNNVIGLLGVSIDITDKKESERLKSEEEERFRSIANQVAHDIRSPLASLLMVVRECAEISENHRIALREAARGIGDIANHLLYQYQNKETDSHEVEVRQDILVSTALMELLTAKKYQYKNSLVKLDYHFDKDTQFAFIKMQLSAFKRMISNLINNAADAFDNNPGQVALQLGADNEWVKISIQDTGKGMPQEMIKKILKKTSFTEGKEAGHGIGLMQVWETLEINQGELHIESKPGKGTTMVVKFPRTKAPYWIIDEILLIKNDIVIILDDDTSIHGAWQTRFDSIIDKNNNIQLKHFQAGKEVLAFIYSLSPEEKERILLLSDYELLNQELNGLHIIEKSGIKRSILVTSHYADPLLRELSAKTDTKILPKQLASEILIKILSDGTKIPTKVDAVLVEDDEVLSSHFALYVFKDKRVDQYVNPEGLLKNIHGYSKTTKIYLDNNYKNSLQKGIDVAKHLHQQGYERLYLLSGESFRKEELPEYLTVIRKEDIESLRNSINS